jgi:hypothetical protein
MVFIACFNEGRTITGEYDISKYFDIDWIGRRPETETLVETYSQVRENTRLL